MLFSGPSPAEKRAGLRTELPMIRGEMIVRMDREECGSGSSPPSTSSPNWPGSS